MHNAFGPKRREREREHAPRPLTVECRSHVIVRCDGECGIERNMAQASASFLSGGRLVRRGGKREETGSKERSKAAFRWVIAREPIARERLREEIVSQIFGVCVLQLPPALQDGDNRRPVRRDDHPCGAFSSSDVIAGECGYD